MITDSRFFMQLGNLAQFCELLFLNSTASDKRTKVWAPVYVLCPQLPSKHDTQRHTCMNKCPCTQTQTSKANKWLLFRYWRYMAYHTWHITVLVHQHFTSWTNKAKCLPLKLSVTSLHATLFLLSSKNDMISSSHTLYTFLHQAFLVHITQKIP